VEFNMEVKKLQEYYNTINECSLSLKKDADFDYVQTQLAKMAVFNDTLNTVIGEVSVEQTILRNKHTNGRFAFDVHATDLASNDPRVTQLATAKERHDYIHFFLLKDDYKELIDLDASIKDLEQLLKLAHKKSRDIEKLYNKLKMLWDTIQLELKTIKRLGSDGDFIDKVRNDLDSSPVKPIFTDDAVEQIKMDQYNNTDKLEDEAVNSLLEGTDEGSTPEDKLIDIEVDSLLEDI